MNEQMLCKTALQAMQKAYAPYSHHLVGAALLTASGKVYTGCNVENASFSPTICAERTAVCKAVSEGEREFKMIAIAGGMDGKVTAVCAPCGVCRQVLSEFCGPDFPILLVKGQDTFEKITLGELLPLAFSL